MRCIPTPAIFLRNVTEEGWTPSRAGKDALAEALYILTPMGVLLLIALIPTGLPQVSWEVYLDVYGPVSRKRPPGENKERGLSIAHFAKAWATKSFNSLSSLPLFLTTIWQFGASQHRALLLGGARTSQLRLFLLVVVPAAAIYATLGLNYSGEGLFTVLLSCLTHMIDVVMLVFGDTQLKIETWG